MNWILKGIWCVSSFFIISMETYAAQLKLPDGETLHELCMEDNRRDDLIKYYINSFGQGFHYQAAALGVTQEELAIESVDRDCDIENGKRRAVATFRTDVTYFGYRKVTCRASFDQDCKESLNIKVDAGWQACSISYRVTEDYGKTYPIKVTPKYWVNGDIEVPNRYFGYNIKYRARGNQSYANPKRGLLTLEDLLVKAIPIAYDNKKRREHACDFPINPNSIERKEPPPEIPSETQSPSSDIKVTLSKEGDKAVLTFHNAGKGFGTVRYRLKVKVEEPRSNPVKYTWKEVVTGTEPLRANAIHNKDYIRHGAKDWKLEYWL